MLEMKVCAFYKIKHSEYLEWDVDDRDKAIWFHVRESETCPSCGTREIEWDPDQGGNRQAYGTEIRRCRGCEVKEAAEDSEDAKVGRGVYVRLRRNLAHGGS